jgi:hypothetical protein
MLWEEVDMVGTLLSLLGCGFSAPEDVVAGSGGEDTGRTGETTTPDETDSAEPPDPSDVDDDGDGYTENQGDCDDEAATVHPGAVDGCDGTDEDCDGSVDEDAADDDDYEPNDDDPYDLGSINDDPEQAIQGLLHNDDDVDRFTFHFEDTWSPTFELDISLSSIPSGARYRLLVENLTTGETLADEVGDGSLSAGMSEDLFDDQTADFAVTISAEEGADCDRNYLLTLELR